MDVDIHDETLLARVVRDWVERELPDEHGLAERAASSAATAYHEGATVADACAAAQSFVRSWCRHPSHSRPVPAGSKLAS